MPAPHNAYSPTTNKMKPATIFRGHFRLDFISLLSFHYQSGTKHIVIIGLGHVHRVPFRLQRLRPTPGSRQNPYPVRMRRTAAGPLRSREDARNVEPRVAGRRTCVHVALRSRAPGPRSATHRLAGRGVDTRAEGVPPRSHTGGERSLG